MRREPSKRGLPRGNTTGVKPSEKVFGFSVEVVTNNVPVEIGIADPDSLESFHRIIDPGPLGAAGQKLDNLLDHLRTHGIKLGMHGSVPDVAAVWSGIVRFMAERLGNCAHAVLYVPCGRRHGDCAQALRWIARAAGRGSLPPWLRVDRLDESPGVRRLQDFQRAWLEAVDDRMSSSACSFHSSTSSRFSCALSASIAVADVVRIMGQQANKVPGRPMPLDGLDGCDDGGYDYPEDGRVAEELADLGVPAPLPVPEPEPEPEPRKEPKKEEDKSAIFSDPAVIAVSSAITVLQDPEPRESEPEPEPEPRATILYPGIPVAVFGENRLALFSVSSLSYVTETLLDGLLLSMKQPLRPAIGSTVALAIRIGGFDSQFSFVVAASPEQEERLMLGGDILAGLQALFSVGYPLDVFVTIYGHRIAIRTQPFASILSSVDLSY